MPVMRADSTLWPLSQRPHHSRKWRRLRNRHLAANPLCVRCLADGFTAGAEQVDHRVPAHLAPDRFFDPDNLQSLCASCHRQKTDEDLRRHGRPGRSPRKGRPGPDIGPDGLPLAPPETGPDGLPVAHSSSSSSSSSSGSTGPTGGS